MNRPKSYYKQMLIFIGLSIILSITTIYFAINKTVNSNPKNVPTEQSAKIEKNTTAQSNDVIEKEIDVENETHEFVSQFVSTLFNYDEKNYKQQIEKVEDSVTPAVYDKLQKGLFFASPEDNVTSKLSSTDYYWQEKSDNVQSVIVELGLVYSVNKEEMNLKQLIKLDIEIRDDTLVIYNYLLLNNPT